ncbi:MAG TPA: DUF4922 domain-containing protein [Bacteroidota bacterium]|nr:DUF4922 domain-containing protein [Bacteroidota bacterium]
MRERLLLDEGELTHRLSQNLQILLRHQKQTWDVLRRNYEDLDAVETRSLSIGNSTVHLQHNPARLTSTSARVDEESIRSRPCFLCLENLPEVQRGLAYGDEFVILCNPFPIFPEHFTIVHRRHTPQRFEPVMRTFVELSRELGEEYVVLYNGPRCGASAPDHLHLQVGNSGFLPLEDEYERMIMQGGEKIADKEGVVAFGVEEGGRRFLAIESDDIDDVRAAIRAAFVALDGGHAASDEPMVNILSWFREGEWRVVLFPRAKHRPECFDAPEERRLVISPAAVDLSGVVIAPRRSDFERITAHDVAAIFVEVLLSPEAFSRFKEEYTKQFYALRG